jgi:hypothetical protein
VSKKDDKVREDEYQPSESDDKMSEINMLLSEAPRDYYKASQSEVWVLSMSYEQRDLKF